MSRTDTAGRARLWPPAVRIFSPLATLRGRIIAGFALLVIILTVVIASAAWLTREDHAILAKTERDAALASALRDAKLDSAIAVTSLGQYVLTGDDALAPAVHALWARAIEAVERSAGVEQEIGYEQGALELHNIAARASALSQTWDSVLALRKSGDVPGATALLTASFPEMLQFQQQFDSVIEVEHQEAIALRDRANVTASLVFWLLVASGTLGVALAMAVSVFLARSILRPLSRLESAALAIAGGDLAARAPVTGPRELVRVGASFNQMTEALLDLNRSLEDQVRARTGELRASEARYRSLTENTFDLVLETSIDGHFTFASPSYRDVLGYEPGELLGTSIFDLVHPDDRPAVMEEFRRAISTGSPGAAVYRSRRKDGEWLWLESAGKPFKSDAGETRAVIVSRDITERKRIEDKLRESEERTRSIIDTSYDAFISIDAHGVITDWNAQAEATFGWSREEAIGRPLAETIIPPQHREAHQKGLQHFQATGEGPVLNKRTEFTALHRDGHEFPIELAVWPVRMGPTHSFNAFARDITDRKQAEETIRRMAYHDPLTGLPNRALFEDRFSVALAQARRAGQSLCLMSVDVDHFKLVNDTLGHAAGDAILKAAGERLTGLVREGDTVARIGGDEFLLLLPGDLSAADASRVATDIRNAFRKPFHLDGQEVHATISIGISFYPQDGESADELLRNADAALYKAKELGRSNYQLYTPSMNIGAAERLALDRELRDALEHEEFDIYYQPQVAISTGRVLGAEALLRWRHPSRGVVSPDEFIPAAEETGLIVPLGKWVLRAVCTQAQAWQAAQLPSLRVAVNISMRQFQEAGFVQTVAQVLKETGLNPARLELEITESTAMRDAAFTISVLRQLREMGVRISIDDFGTGHSSLRYLRDFPIHALKIDQSFVRDLTTDPHDAALASEIIALGHRLGLEIVAEGVETPEQLDLLRAGGCDLFQGYLCAKPMPAAFFEGCLRSGTSPCGKLFPTPAFEERRPFIPDDPRHR